MKSTFVQLPVRHSSRHRRTYPNHNVQCQQQTEDMMRKEGAYSCEDNRNGDTGYWTELFWVDYTFILRATEPHGLDGLVKDWVEPHAELSLRLL